MKRMFTLYLILPRGAIRKVLLLDCLLWGLSIC